MKISFASLKKSGAIVVILFSLWGQLSNNTSIRIPLLSGMLTKLTTWVGVGTYWQMFSRVDRFNWRVEFVAIAPNNKIRILPIFNADKDNFIENNFMNVREGKINQNIFTYRDDRYNYAQYLCRVYQQEDQPIKAIRLDLYWQKILPPNEAEIRKEYLTAEFFEKEKLGRVKCQNY